MRTKLKCTDKCIVGKKELSEMTEEELENLRSSCHTLHYVKALMLQSRRADRQLAGGKTQRNFTQVGFILRSDVELQVPRISCEYTKETGIPKDRIENRVVRANEEFVVTNYELMFLLFRPEYAGSFEKDGNPYGVSMVLRMTKFLNNSCELPTPTFTSQQESIKENMDPIDEYDTVTRQWA